MPAWAVVPLIDNLLRHELAKGTGGRVLRYFGRPVHPDGKPHPLADPRHPAQGEGYDRQEVVGPHRLTSCVSVTSPNLDSLEAIYPVFPYRPLLPTTKCLLLIFTSTPWFFGFDSSPSE